MVKVKVEVVYELDLPVTLKEAKRNYPDAEYPLDCHALDYISEQGLSTLVGGAKSEVQGVRFYD